MYPLFLLTNAYSEEKHSRVEILFSRIGAKGFSRNLTEVTPDGAPQGLRTTLSSLLLTTYYLLLTTYFNSYFLSFFSPFAEKTLTNFNIHTTCFVNYKGPASAENTHNFSYNTHNFSFSPNIFSDSPSNFTVF